MEAHAAKQSGDGTGARAGLVNEDHGALALELAEFVLDLVGGNVAAVGDVSLREVGRLADVDDLGTLAIDELGRLSGRDFGSVAAGMRRPRTETAITTISRLLSMRNCDMFIAFDYGSEAP